MNYLYTYQITDFPNSEVDLSALENEISKNNSLVDILDYINMTSPIVDIYFTEELSVGEQNMLDTIVENHDPTDNPQESQIAGDVSIGGSIYINSTASDLDQSNFAVVDPSSGLCDSTIPFSVYGTEFHWAENMGVSSTTSSSFLTKVSLTTSNLPSGTYRIIVNYGWSQSDGDGAFEGRVLLNSNQLGETHKVYPTTGDKFGNGNIDNDWLDFSSREFAQILSGVNTVEIQWRQSGGNTAKIADANIQIFRVL